MTRHDVVIIKDSHRGLLYEDGILKEVLPAGRHTIARPGSDWLTRVGLRRSVPISEVVLIDVRRSDRTIVVPALLTADLATITASFVVTFRVTDPRAATQEVRNPSEMLQAEFQTAARRLLRGMTLEEIVAGRDEIGEELLMIVADSASGYGIEVSEVDVKDLSLPDEFRETMNRAVYTKSLRRLLPIDCWGEKDQFTEAAEDESAPLVAASVPSEPRLIFPIAQDDMGARPHPSEFASEGFESSTRYYRTASE